MSRREKRELEEQAQKERKRREREAKRKNSKKTEKKELVKEEKEIVIEIKPNKNSKKTTEEKRKAKDRNRKKESIIGKIIKTILKVFLILILLIILVLGCFIGWLGFTTNWDLDKMLKKGAKQVALIATGQTEADIANLDPLYCLVLGVSTDEGLTLTDTIILCAYYPRTQQASMLSIPRDTFVGKSEATANSYSKINAQYAEGDANKTLEAVEKLTGLEINNYLVVKNEGLIQIVDAIGGVDFNVPINMDYDDYSQDLFIHLKAGPQRIYGNQAEQLLRFRHNNDGSSYPASYGDNDIGRMRTQREFITETIKQTIKLNNVTKINELIEIAFSNIETNLDMDYVMKYSPAVVEFDASAIQTAYLPGTASSFGPYNLSFFRADKTATKKVIQDLFIFKQNQYDSGADNTSILPANLKIQLLNASGDETTFENTKKRLENNGYNIEEIGITTISKTTKIINRTDKKQETVDELINVLGYGDEAKGKDILSCDFTIIVGEDMKQLK